MQINRHIIKYTSLFSLLLLFLGGITACTKDVSVSNYKESAEKLCEIYTPFNLNKLREGLTSDQMFYKRLGDKSREINDDSQFQSIFKKAFDSGKRDFAMTIQDEVSALLGEKWKCENMNKYYSMTFNPVDDDQDNTKFVQITLKLSPDGFLNFNDTKYKYNEPKLWQSALQEFITRKSATDIEILAPEGMYIDGLNPLFKLLSDSGIRQRHVAVQEYKFESENLLSK